MESKESHVSMDAATRERRNTYMREYYRRNRERLLEASRARAAADPEYTKQRRRERHRQDREKEGPAAVMCRNARYRAKQRGLPFDLVAEEIVVPTVCPLLGIPLRIDNCGQPAPDSPSLDRIDPRLGYVRGNVQVISYKANTMKQDATPAELLRFAHSITTAFGMCSGYPHQEQGI